MVIMKALNVALSFAGIPPLPVPTLHTGGIAGEGNARPMKNASPAWFTNAVRYHGGGIAGLAPNEVPAVLEKGEEVLTEQDPRHRKNGGLNPASEQPSAAPTIRVINAIDSGDLVSAGLSSPPGEEAFLNAIRGKSGQIKEILGTT